jgi:glycosyltransferase involved in cell wall biosynthesis
MRPLISIITPSLNRADMIRDAIKSVLAQNYSKFEHIIIDGGSTDGTLEILTKYPHLRVLSEPDKGMYDAINKGLGLARGDVIGFLNSDDLYEANRFDGVAKKFADESTLAVAGRAIVFKLDSDGLSEIIGDFSPKSASLLALSTTGRPFFNAWFFHKSVFEKIGHFNTRYRIAADRDFMLRFALAGLKYEVFDALVYQYRQHANSMTFDMSDEKLEKVVKEHIFMTGSYLCQPKLPLQVKQLILDAHTRDTIEVGIRAIKKLRLSKFIFFMRAGWHYDFQWPYKLLKRVLVIFFHCGTKKNVVS